MVISLSASHPSKNIISFCCFHCTHKFMLFAEFDYSSLLFSAAAQNNTRTCNNSFFLPYSLCSSTVHENLTKQQQRIQLIACFFFFVTFFNKFHRFSEFIHFSLSIFLSLFLHNLFFLMIFQTRRRARVFRWPNGLNSCTFGHKNNTRTPASSRRWTFFSLFTA